MDSHGYSNSDFVSELLSSYIHCFTLYACLILHLYGIFCFGVCGYFAHDLHCFSSLTECFSEMLPGPGEIMFATNTHRTLPLNNSTQLTDDVLTLNEDENAIFVLFVTVERITYISFKVDNVNVKAVVVIFYSYTWEILVRHIIEHYTLINSRNIR